MLKPLAVDGALALHLADILYHCSVRISDSNQFDDLIQFAKSEQYKARCAEHIHAPRWRIELNRRVESSRLLYYSSKVVQQK